jgi:hypothetical protein
MTGRMYNENLGRFACLLVFIGFNMTFKTVKTAIRASPACTLLKSKLNPETKYAVTTRAIAFPITE